MKGERNAGKTGRRITIAAEILLLIVFVYSVYRLLSYYLEYREQNRLYGAAAEAYVEEVPAGEEASVESRKSENGWEQPCPISVDFAALCAENEEIVGWLYCEDTNINYPVVQGADNEYYLHHTYDGKAGRAGAIFVDAGNRAYFADSNTIIYGHHMKDGSMFAHLSDFADQEYFDDHPVMWLLTPGQNYKVELYGGYLTEASSDSYTIFTGACQEFDDYLRETAAACDVEAETEKPGEARYIMLSTCEYVFEDARYVLHGRLVPVEVEV